MTLAENLNISGVDARNGRSQEAFGFTKNGKPFYMCRASGAYGIKYTLHIDGEIKATSCLFRTAVKLINQN